MRKILDATKLWVMSWGSHALVLEPESLRDEIRAEVEATLHRYEREEEKEEKPMEPEPSFHFE